MNDQKNRDFWIRHSVLNQLLPAVLDIEYIQNHLGDPEIPEIDVKDRLDKVLNNLERVREFVGLLSALHREPETATSLQESLAEALALVEHKRLDTGIDIEIQNKLPKWLPGVNIDKSVLTLVLVNLLLDSIKAVENLTDTKHVITVSGLADTQVSSVLVIITNPHRPSSGQESKMFLFGDPPNIGDDDLPWVGEAIRTRGKWIMAKHTPETGMQFEIYIPFFKK